MATNTINGDLYVAGTFKANSMSIPSNSVGSTQINGNDPVAVSKLKHLYTIIKGQKHTETANAERRVVHVAGAAGTISTFRILASVANIGNSTVSVDLLKNGTSILSSVPQLTSSDAAYAQELGTLSSTSYAIGDVFEINITVSAGTGTLAKGVNSMLILDEGA